MGQIAEGSGPAAFAATLLPAGIEETLHYCAFPREHWRYLRTNNPLERLLRELRRRTKAVRPFSDGKSALAAARLGQVAGTSGYAPLLGHETPGGSQHPPHQNSSPSPWESRAPPHLTQQMCEKLGTAWCDLDPNLDAFRSAFGLHHEQSSFRIRAEFPDIGFEAGAIGNYFEDLPGFHVAALTQHFESRKRAFHAATVHHFL